MSQVPLKDHLVYGLPNTLTLVKHIVARVGTIVHTSTIYYVDCSKTFCMVNHRKLFVKFDLENESQLYIV